MLNYLKLNITPKRQGAVEAFNKYVLRNLKKLFISCINTPFYLYTAIS